MSEFVNRVSSDLNKRTLNVLDVTRDEETGEIKSMEVEVSRGDTPTVVGTPLDADVFNEIIKKMIDESPMVESQRKIVNDKNSLNIPLVVETPSISLPTTGNNQTSIQWQSSKPNVITTSGTVVKGSQDEEVTLTAIITLGDYTAVKTFDVLVVSYTDNERVNLDKQSLYVSSSVDDDFTLTTTGAKGSTITWSSSNSDYIYISGGYAEITRGDTNRTVTLTATISYGEAVVTKTFTVTVLANENVNPYTTSCDFSVLDISLDYFTSSTQTYDLYIYADNGNGINVDVYNTYSSYYNISVSGNGEQVVTVTLSEKSSNMPNKDGGYDFEVTVRNKNNEVIETRTITIAYI